MSLRGFLTRLDSEGRVRYIREPVDPYLEAARILREYDGEVVVFENVKGSEFKIAAGLCADRGNFARAAGVGRKNLLKAIADAIDRPSPPRVVEGAPCREVVEETIDLARIPILTHTSRDLGPYITAGVWITRNAEGRHNMAFHRASPIAPDRLVARICHRDTWRNLKEGGGEIPVAICLGLDPTVLLAASVSASGVCEFDIANALKTLEVTPSLTSDLLVPATSEIVLEGVLTTKELHTEGPFPDITDTFDVVRNEPVMIVRKITRRRDAFYQALLPAYREHRLLMGMPKEPTIFRAVNRVARCIDVRLTPGGCSWLHAVVQIEKRNADEGLKAAEAAFEGHGSLKHCVVVDTDIDIDDPNDVEWAVATRAQADRDVKVWRGPGSSLDASAEKQEGSDRLLTAKVAVDATAPWDKDRGLFEKAVVGE